MPTFLVVSPYPNNAKNLADLLPGSVRITHVSNLYQAVHLFESKMFPDIVIIDEIFITDLPQFQNDILDHVPSKNIPVIALIRDISRRETALNAGADDYLLIPLLPQEINNRISPFLQLNELSLAQEETQLSAARMAFIVLISRLISESLDLAIVLSQTVQQTLNLFQCSGCEVWLFEEDEETLTLASSLFHTPIALEKMQQRSKGQGLIGWLGEHNEIMHVETIADDPRYLPNHNWLIQGLDQSSMLAIPLSVKLKKVGILVLYREKPNLFSNQDIELIKEVAPLLAATVANAQMVESLQYHTEQHAILYEMSQQINSGLDLGNTLNRSVQWLNRLSDAEISTIWLSSPDEIHLEAVAALGIHLPAAPITIPSPASRDVEELAPLFNEQWLINALNFRPRNVLVLPMLHRNRLLGMAVLFNKIGGDFPKQERQLLNLAIEIIVVSINNAQLYNQSTRLIEEKERLYKQAIQNERLRTIGRLTASVAHEINNPMQAIRGALSLALEDIDSPEDLREYIRISQQEVDRVVKLVNRMRQLYRPPKEQIEAIQIPAMLQEILDTSRDELTRQQIKVRMNFPENFPVIYGVANQLHLAFLSIVLNMADEIGNSGLKEFSVSACDLQDYITVEFSTPHPLTSIFQLKVDSQKEANSTQPEALYNLSPVIDLLTANGGTLSIRSREDKTIILIELSKYLFKTDRKGGHGIETAEDLDRR